MKLLSSWKSKYTEKLITNAFICAKKMVANESIGDQTQKFENHS